MGEYFHPFSKNPSTVRVFREIGYADELGSGMCNTYKYTCLYSHAKPQLIEKDIFITSILHKKISTLKVGIKNKRDKESSNITTFTKFEIENKMEEENNKNNIGISESTVKINKEYIALKI